MRFLIALAAAMVVMFFVGYAQGQTACPPSWAPRGAVIANLAKVYSEAPVAVGLSSGGSLVELAQTPDGSSWTLVNTRTNGCSRIIASGENWMAVPPKVIGYES